jgi:hypothetical protein
MLAKESPEFVAKCAAYARMDREVERGLFIDLASKDKINAETVMTHLLLRLLLNAQ